MNLLKDSPDSSHFIFEINVGKWRIRHTMKNRLKIQIHGCYMSDPPLSDIDFNNKMAWFWTTLKIKEKVKIYNLRSL